MNTFKKSITHILLGGIILGSTQLQNVHAKEVQDVGEQGIDILNILGAGSGYAKQFLKHIHEVKFTDVNLKNAIYKELGKESHESVTISDLEGLTSLDLSELDIKNLDGIQYCTNLTNLVLLENGITDITPLAGLSNLEVLDLAGNNISDISPLQGLKELTVLSLAENQVRDVGPLSGLYKLEMLTLDGNEIRDITPLSGLTNLEYLFASYNNISNMTPVSGLNKLILLHLTDNSISDISTVKNINATDIQLQGNPIDFDDEKVKEIIEHFKELGYKVKLKEEIK